MSLYFNKGIYISQEKLKVKQLKLLNRQLKRANRTDVYQGRLPQKIKDLSDIQNIPFTTKEDLRQNFPYGFLAVSKEKIARFNATSGTTGIPTLCYFTKKDLNKINKRIEIQLSQYNGVKSGDVFQSTFSLGMPVGGWSYYHAIQSLNATFVPTGIGNSLKQIIFLKNLKADFILANPSFLLHIYSLLSPEDRKEINLRKAIVIGEPITKQAKEMFKREYSLELFEGYGMTECGGGLGVECSSHDGIHISEDCFYVEIINPDTGEILPDGEYGELVVTPLQQEAMPLIRYRTRDITRIIPFPCPCGGTHRRIEPIAHRIDDMIIINGSNVFPSQVEECIYQHISTATNYLIHVLENAGLRKLLIDIELSSDLLNNKDAMKTLENNLLKSLKSSITVTPKLNFIPIGQIEPRGKAQRVIYEKGEG